MSLLKVSGVCKSFGSNHVLSSVSFSIDQGEIVGLIGPSGGGKSTLLKIIGEVLTADSGEIDRGGVDPEDISLMFQEGALFDSLNVADNVAFSPMDGRVPLSRVGSDDRHKVVEDVSVILSRVGLFKAAAKMPAQISGGMRRRVSLARALVSRPHLALLDDPTAGLDPVASSVIMDLIVELHRELNQTTLIAGHDLRRLLPICDSIVCLFDGKVVFHKPVSELCFAPEAVQQFVACRYDIKVQTGSDQSGDISATLDE